MTNPEDYVLYLGGFLVGISIGSFLGCGFYRWPRGMSVMKGRSHCVGCDKVLTPVELVPVGSYVWQKGKCSCGKAELSAKYVLSEIACGIIGVAAVYAYFLFAK